jgi:signal transduction histidine kinase
MGKAVKDAADEILAANPDSVLQVETTGDLRGNWDPARISQVITNLLGNAVQHGSARTTITISAKGEATSVVLRVRNRSPVIAASELPGIFGPFKRLRPGQPTDGGASNSLGLGLYIAERIVTAHGGTIEVESSEEIGTAFTVRLPR